MAARRGYRVAFAAALATAKDRLLRLSEANRAGKLSHGALHCPFDSTARPKSTGQIRNAPNGPATSGWRRAGREWGTTIAEFRSDATFYRAIPHGEAFTRRRQKISHLLADENTAV